MAQGPYCTAAILCERIIEGKDGVLTLIRLIDSMQLTRYHPGQPVPVDPSQGNVGLFAPFTFVVQIKSGDYRGRGDVTIRFTNPKGKMVFEKSFAIDLLGEQQGHNLILQGGLQPEEQGVYWFEVYFENRLLTRSPLSVQIQESDSSLKTNTGVVQAREDK